MESWVGVGANGSTAVMTEWQTFVSNQVRLHGGELRRPEAGLHRPAAVHDRAGAGRADILNVGGFSDAVFSVVAAFLEDDGERFVSDVEAVEV